METDEGKAPLTSDAGLLTLSAVTGGTCCLGCSPEPSCTTLGLGTPPPDTGSAPVPLSLGPGCESWSSWLAVTGLSGSHPLVFVIRILGWKRFGGACVLSLPQVCSDWRPSHARVWCPVQGNFLGWKKGAVKHLSEGLGVLLSHPRARMGLSPAGVIFIKHLLCAGLCAYRVPWDPHSQPVIWVLLYPNVTSELTGLRGGRNLQVHVAGWWWRSTLQPVLASDPALLPSPPWRPDTRLLTPERQLLGGSGQAWAGEGWDRGSPLVPAETQCSSFRLWKDNGHWGQQGAGD